MSRERFLDGLLVVLLVVALVQAVLLGAGGGAVRAYVPLLGEADPPGHLQAPGGAARALAAKAAAVGEFITVEDLARGVLALSEGSVAGAAPLTDAERAAIAPIVRKAAEDRQALLVVEGEIAELEARLQERARGIAATLTPEQRAWIVAQRDAVSVGEVEQAYWDELLALAPP
ncbi:MAG: hypothetical protein Q8P18_29805 [Pseudomonadota bacterium]|nr:hypothetical protein [Pseudomonadota bacterium]